MSAKLLPLFDEPAPESGVVRKHKPHQVQGKVLTMPPRGQTSLFREDYSDLPERPKTRGECAEGPRPCPWVSCSHHLYLMEEESGAIRLSFPGIEPEEMPVSCALDVAERQPATMQAIGAMMRSSQSGRVARIVGKAKAKRLAPLPSIPAWALDAEGRLCLEAIGRLMAMSRESIRQVEARAMAEVRSGMAGFVD